MCSNGFTELSTKCLQYFRANDEIEVVTPEANMGDVVGDLNRRRGLIEGMDDRAGSKVVKAKVPLSEMFGYVTRLRTITSGRATSQWSFLILQMLQRIFLKR